MSVAGPRLVAASSGDAALEGGARLVSYSEARALLGGSVVSVSLMRKWAAQGKLRVVRLGRRVGVPLAEVERIAREGVR